MKRALVFCMALSICFIALGLKPEERPLAKKVDHIFITSAQAQEPANPLLGTGLGVDHIGIAVRDFKKTRDDYEQTLGFKFMEIPPQPDGMFESHSRHKLEPYDGFYGRSIMFPPDLTHGVWMEFFQR